MNFIDRYNEEHKGEEVTEDETLEQLKEDLAESVFQHFAENQPPDPDMEKVERDVTALACLYIEIYKLFQVNLRGRATPRQIRKLFYDFIGRTLS
jgi:hypothetical protein